MRTALQDEIEYLREEVQRLRETFSGPAISYPVEWRLSRTQRRCLRVLAAHEMVSNDQMYAAIYYDRKERDDRNISWHIWALRQKLRPFGIQIETSFGFGYYLTPESRELLKAR